MPAKPIMSLSDVESLKEQGWSQSDIARHYGVTRQYISWIKRHYGGKLSPREMVNQHFPFVVSTEQGQCTQFKRLRDHGEYVATDGIGMSENKLSRLRSFYQMLRDKHLVIEFDPNIPPAKGFGKHGGWAYRPRVESDADLLIRVNEYTNLTEAGRMIWRFPPVEPGNIPQEVWFVCCRFCRVDPVDVNPSIG
ncbi:XRE family transcriptional regulator [Williamsia sp. CHRR-6]|uniref:XRE family transcriptional regulator n=1 Tax=Williamsia sp. CHRR-6 TaxID=2835871 RepID=UPI001BDB0D6E|nr:XRE family transcriptional regulator [Williamsia sp. CHRR-6]MBT0565542.1 XRE family transcriptional regulator [Williamsia sp. CHRR-6]